MMKNNGISILEIVIVIIILGVAAIIIGPAYSEASVEKKLSVLVDDLEKVRGQIELYRIEHDGLWPGQYRQGGQVEADEFIEALVEGDSPYLREMPVNRFNGLSSVVISGNDRKTTGAGWCFNPVTGEFRADDSKEHGAY
ncbi:MAG: hypothetical protein KAS23_16270 [Anaerohalosphaera sp.]|nr:hypothetical protein [Anaerohalosphaera sp.]